ncbi:MAG: LysR family transcriptional regulator, partial [Gammaproteobacteria bacterium]|nr:LysR family transcriptional regulator [Gammaproteobacteria bacterium]
MTDRVKQNDRLDWDHLRHFVAVVNAGTVIGAARFLGVSHSTVLRNVSRLETTLGIRLFDRVQSGYRVTQEGEEIFEDARAMEVHAEALVRRAMGKHPAPEGLLKLVVSDGSLFDLMGLLRDFRKEFPRIELSIGTAPGSAEQGLTELKADVAIVVTNAPPEDLVGRQLARITFAYYASHEYLASWHGETPEPTDCDWITWSLDESPDIDMEGPWQRNILHRLAPNPKIALRAVHHGDALAGVRAGVGVSLLRDSYEEELVRLPFKAV